MCTYNRVQQWCVLCGEREISSQCFNMNFNHFTASDNECFSFSLDFKVLFAFNIRNLNLFLKAPFFLAKFNCDTIRVQPLPLGKINLISSICNEFSCAFPPTESELFLEKKVA